MLTDTHPESRAVRFSNRELAPLWGAGWYDASQASTP